MKRKAELKAELIELLQNTPLTVAEINDIYKKILICLEAYSKPDETP